MPSPLARQDFTAVTSDSQGSGEMEAVVVRCSQQVRG